MTSIFDIIKSINDHEYLEWEEIFKLYNSYIINKGFSFFPDSIMQANMMNQYNTLDKKLQYDYLFNSIRKRKRYSKWFKSMKSEDFELIQNVFGYNYEKTKDAMKILSGEELNNFKQLMKTGGEEKNDQ